MGRGFVWWTTPRGRIVIGGFVLLALPLVATLIVDVNSYLGGPPQQFVVTDQGQMMGATTFCSVRLPAGPLTLSIDTRNASFLNHGTGRAILLDWVRFCRIDLGIRITVREADGRVSQRFFVSRWKRLPVTYDAGNAVQILVQDGLAASWAESSTAGESVNDE